MGIIDSLFVRLGFQVDATHLEEFEHLAEKAQNTMLGLGAAIAGAATGIGLMVEHASSSMGDVYHFAEQMGITAREVEALGKVALENNSSLEAMKGGIQSLTVMTGQAAAGIGRGAMLFRKWGLHAKNADGSTKDFDEMLGDVVERLASLDRTKRISLGQRLGFDMATIELMSKGRENFERLRAEALKANPLAEEEYRLAEKTEKAFKKAHASIGLLNKRIAVALMPAVNRMLDMFIAWTKEKGNVAKLTRAVQDVAHIVEVLWRNLGKVLTVIGIAMTYKMGAWFGDWAGKAMKAASEMGTLTAAGRLLKNMLTGGLIAAIFLVAEDLWVFYHGGESVTGLLLRKFPYAVQTMQMALVGLSAALVLVTSSNPALAAVVFTLGSMAVIAKELKDNWDPIMQWWQEQWDGLFNSIARVWNAIPKPLRRGLGWVTTGDFSGEEMSLDVLKNAERSRLKLMQFRTEPFRAWSEEDPWAAPGSKKPSWLTPRGAGSGTTNIGGVTFNFPHVAGGKEAGEAAWRELTRLAHGGVGG